MELTLRDNNPIGGPETYKWLDYCEVRKHHLYARVLKVNRDGTKKWTQPVIRQLWPQIGDLLFVNCRVDGPYRLLADGTQDWGGLAIFWTGYP